MKYKFLCIICSLLVACAFAACSGKRGNTSSAASTVSITESVSSAASDTVSQYKITSSEAVLLTEQQPVSESSGESGVSDSSKNTSSATLSSSAVSSQKGEWTKGWN